MTFDTALEAAREHPIDEGACKCMARHLVGRSVRSGARATRNAPGCSRAATKAAKALTRRASGAERAGQIEARIQGQPLVRSQTAEARRVTVVPALVAARSSLTVVGMTFTVSIRSTISFPSHERGHDHGVDHLHGARPRPEPLTEPSALGPPNDREA